MELINGYYLMEVESDKWLAVPQARFEAEQSAEKQSPAFWHGQWMDVSNGGYHPLGGIFLGTRESLLESLKVDTLFVLGTSDPEMCEIEALLEHNMRTFQYAMKEGRRVNPGNAYQADPIHVYGIKRVVLIECNPANDAYVIESKSGSSAKEPEIQRIDHHRPGDPGYGLSPEQYWEASSIGQFFDLIGLNPSQEALVLAAMDHCPSAAIRGECPGVSAQEVLDRKVAEIAAATKHSPEEVQERIGYYAARLEDAPAIFIGEHAISDLRSEYLGEGYSLDLLSAQVAALAGGYTVLLYHRDAPGKPEKWSISGHASPEDIQGFMKYWAPSKGLTGIYGVPNRGYAGGYIPQ